MAIIKENLLYTKTHEWVEAADGVARVGITDYARTELGDLVFAEAMPVGRRLAPGQMIGAVESVKVAADILSPLTGEIIESWPDMDNSLDKISADPFSVWFVGIRMTDPAELSGLMDAAAYETFCATGG